MNPTARLTGLSGNEIYCMGLKGLKARGILVGNSVQSMGLFGNLKSAIRGVVGGEISAVTRVIHDGREAAFERLLAEARQHGVDGVVGVSSDLRQLAGNTEFLFIGSGVAAGQPGTPFFSSAGNAQELFCHMDAGYAPVAFVFGNVAYGVGVARGLLGALKTLARGEIQEYSDIFNATRHLALQRLTDHAKKAGANAVVGIRTNVLRFGPFHEMYMTGTAAKQPALESNGLSIVTSDLTGEELWGMSSLGYLPLKLLISTSVYSLGIVGGITAAFSSLARGEINELTTLVYDAREQVFERMNREAQQLGADQVVGIKTYVVELGSSLVEIFAVGTAVREGRGIAVASQQLPAQAIIRDRDTWVDGEMSFDVTSIRAGG